MLSSFQNYFDISIGLKKEQIVNAFGLEKSEIRPDIRSRVNCDTLSFNVHGSLTHTECIGHIQLGTFIKDIKVPPLMYALCINSTDNFQAFESDPLFVKLEALIIKFGVKEQDWTGKNPPTIKIADNFPKHLLTDLPSIDEEKGDVINHRKFFNMHKNGTITELCDLQHVEPGYYILNLQMINIESDATPSRPILFPINP